jgi:hypothetical protein
MLNNVKGMLIHVDFAVQWRKAIPGETIAFFYRKTGEKVIVNDQGPYRANDGHVAVWVTYTPDFDGTEWKDFKLFIPYYRFPEGELKFNVQVRTNNSQVTLAESQFVSFKISK